MRKILHKYRLSKFKCFVNGLLYAIISMVALILCLTYIFTQADAQVKISLTFGTACISLLLGLLSILGSIEVPSEKI